MGSPRKMGRETAGGPETTEQGRGCGTGIALIFPACSGGRAPIQIEVATVATFPDHEAPARLTLPSERRRWMQGGLAGAGAFREVGVERLPLQTLWSRRSITFDPDGDRKKPGCPREPGSHPRDYRPAFFNIIITT
jgi:hypothetical protein